MTCRHETDTTQHLGSLANFRKYIENTCIISRTFIHQVCLRLSNATQHVIVLSRNQDFPSNIFCWILLEKERIRWLKCSYCLFILILVTTLTNITHFVLWMFWILLSCTFYCLKNNNQTDITSSLVSSRKFYGNSISLVIFLNHITHTYLVPHFVPYA